MQKRIVILGGVGFIGTHLCLRLLEEGHEVFCVDMRDAVNSPLLRSVLQHPLFRYVHHNIINTFGIRCDEIYNLTSPSRVRYNKALPVETLRINMQGAINALDTARMEHARILFASSGCVYGAGYRDPATDPAAGYSGQYILSEGKRAAEALHRAYQEELGVDARIARIFNTYGSGADIMRTFCWVEDMVDGLVRMMEATPSEQTRTLDLGSNHEISIRALAEKIISLTGSRSRIVHRAARPDDARRRIPDISAARRELDWTPRTPLAEGLRRTISYAEKELTDKVYTELTWAEMN